MKLRSGNTYPNMADIEDIAVFVDYEIGDGVHIKIGLDEICGGVTGTVSASAYYVRVESLKASLRLIQDGWTTAK
jgi:hypothetical protein